MRTSGVTNATVLDQRRCAYLLGPARQVHRARAHGRRMWDRRTLNGRFTRLGPQRLKSPGWTCPSSPLRPTPPTSHSSFPPPRHPGRPSVSGGTGRTVGDGLAVSAAQTSSFARESFVWGRGACHSAEQADATRRRPGIQLSQLLHLVLSAIDGQRTTGEIAAKVSTAYPRRSPRTTSRPSCRRNCCPSLLRRADGSSRRQKGRSAARIAFAMSSAIRSVRGAPPPPLRCCSTRWSCCRCSPPSPPSAGGCQRQGPASGAHPGDLPAGSVAGGLRLMSDPVGGFHEFGHAAASATAALRRESWAQVST